ncbi:MAG: L-lactate dehydrogenase [Patescibacteria group bacterium]
MNTGHHKTKAVIVGAGRVGSTLAYALSLKLLVSEIVLIDIDEKRAMGEAMDLNHGLSYYENIKIHSGTYEDAKGASYILITSGISQKPGQTRLDLVKQNVEIIKDIVPKLAEYNSTAQYVLISNPVDVLTYVTLKITGFKRHQVFGTGTTLDTARYKYLIGHHFNVSPSNVHAFIVGEHGDSEVPLLSMANISGVPLTKFEEFDLNKMNEIFESTKTAAYKIVEAKGSTYYAIGLVTAEIVQSMEHNQKKIFPVSSLIEGQLGIENVCLSLPTVVEGTGVGDIINIFPTEEETQKIQASAKVLQQVIKDVGF